MGDVINESREECGDPRSRRATEACHQLVAPNGEITRCRGELLLISLNAGAKKRGGGATSPTGGNAATKLPCGVSGIAGGGGGHDAECCPINVTWLGRALRSGNVEHQGAGDKIGAGGGLSSRRRRSLHARLRVGGGCNLSRGYFVGLRSTFNGRR
jgi:hypothetical protein